MTAVSLHRTDPARRMRRFYLLDVQPDLFGEWSFIREWGRAGQPGQVWAVPFPTEAEATRGGAYAFRGGNGSRTGGGSMRSWMACSSRTRGACAAGMSGLPASRIGYRTMRHSALSGCGSPPRPPGPVAAALFVRALPDQIDSLPPCFRPRCRVGVRGDIPCGGSLR